MQAQRIKELLKDKPYKEQGTHYVTTCPFCDKAEHLYVNMETGAWDCKRCGESGSFSQLANKFGYHLTLPDRSEEANAFHKQLLELPEGEAVIQYLENRGLGKMIGIRKYGYDPESKRITIPYWYRGKCVAIRKRAITDDQKPKYLSSKGDLVMLYNKDDLLNPTLENLIVCEGEFDTDITKLNRPDWAVVGVAGAASFKEHDAKYCHRFRRIIIAMDNDEAGQQGAAKVKKMLPTAEVVAWPETLPEKFDLSDYWQRDDLPPLETMIQSEVGDLIPSTGFIRDYINYCHPLTDAPDAFHLFHALSLLSTAIGRKAWIQSFGGQPLFPNLWIVLVATSSLYRKTTSLSIGSGILNGVQGTVQYPQEFSRESLFDILSVAPQGTFYWSELGSVLSLFSKEYMDGTKDLLADLYDCPDERTRKLKTSEFKFTNAYVNVMSATNTRWLIERIKKADITGGFLARFLYVCVNNKERYMAIAGKPDLTKKTDLQNFLKRLVYRNAEIEFTNDHLRESYTQFLRVMEAEIQNSKNEEILAPFYSRLESYLWKFAMLRMISDGNFSTAITPEAFDWAVRVIDYLKSKLKIILNELEEGDPELRRVLSLIRHTSGGLTKREILRKTRMLDRKVDHVLDTLVKSGSVVTQLDGRVQKYYPAPSGE